MHRMGDGFFSGSGRTSQEQRLGAHRLAGDRLAELANRRALAEQRTVDAAARLAQKFLGNAQLALERRRSLRDPRLERRVRRLQRVGGAPPFLVEPRVVNRARDLVGDDQEQAATMLAERALHGALDREDPDQFVPDQQRDGDLALGIVQAGNRNRVAKLLATARLHHLPSLRRGVGALLAKVAHVQHLALLRHDADDPGADPHTPADRLVFVAAARHDPQGVAARLDEQDAGVVELEQLVHRPKGDVVDLLEIERRIDVGRNAAEDLELRGFPGELRVSSARALSRAPPLSERQPLPQSVGRVLVERDPRGNRTWNQEAVPSTYGNFSADSTR